MLFSGRKKGSLRGSGWPDMTNHPNRRRGRPPLPASDRKVMQSLSLDRDVIEALKMKGPGWMPAANDMLRRALEAEDLLPRR